MSTLLEQAIEHIKAGDKATGINLLTREIKQNPSESAWLWMAFCVLDVNQKKYCFEQALVFNPINEAARKELEKLSSPQKSSLQSLTSTPKKPSPSVGQVTPITQPKIVSVPPVKDQPAPVPVIPQLSQQQSKQRQQTLNTRQQKKKGWSPTVWVSIIVALIGLCGTAITVGLNPNLVSAIIGIVDTNPSFTISVYVADQSGIAVSGAKVLFFYPAGSLSQYTDSNGVSTFAVDNIQIGNMRVIVESNDHQIFEEQVTYPIETTVQARLQPKQERESKVILRTVEDGNSNPISGVEVIIAFGGGLYRQTTDSDGFALLTLPFEDSGVADTQISVNAAGYKIENQFSALTPGKLQYILLTPNALKVEVPVIPAFVFVPIPVTDSSKVTTDTNLSFDTSGATIGSGVEINQQPGEGNLKIIALTSDYKPMRLVVSVHDQKYDVTGTPLRGDRITYDYVNDQGELLFKLNDGMYFVCTGLNGHNWIDDGCIRNIQISTGTQNLIKFQSGKIKFTVITALGNAFVNFWWEVLTQTEDITGKPVTERAFWNGTTDKTGVIYTSELTPGLYVIDFKTTSGYKWGVKPTDRDGIANIPVRKGETTEITIKLGQILFELRKSDGQPDTSKGIYIYTQKNDINGKQILDGYVGGVSTDARGIGFYNLTEGLYAVKINDNVTFNVPVNWGVITNSDGTNYQQQK